jgi:RNA polymerase sigma-70 factor (ECF subfamily)
MTTIIPSGAEPVLLHRPMLLGLAYRMLGSLDDAEDVLQEAYLRWTGVDHTAVYEPRRYLSRIVTHLALDRLRTRQQTPYVGPWLPEPIYLADTDLGPLDTVEARESLALATLHLMERLSPPERGVYVLRAAFDLPYDEIAEIVGRTVTDCRQLHHRARQRIGDAPRFAPTPAEQRQFLDAFVAAAHEGELDRLTSLLTAQATAWSDAGGRVRSALNPLHGAEKVARYFVGIYSRYGAGLAVTPVDVNGQPAVVVTRRSGRHLLTATISDGRATGLFVVANPVKLRRLAR